MNPTNRNVNFGQYFASNITPEWQNHYVNYEELKDLLKHNFADHPSANLTTASSKKFFQKCNEMLTSVALFFSHKLAEARRNFYDIDHEFRAWQKQITISGKFVPNRHLKMALCEFFFQLTLVKRYQVLNQDAFKRLLDKHDKMYRNDSGQKWWMKKVLKTSFGLSLEVETLLAQCRVDVVQLENGDVDAAKSILTVPVREKSDLWTTFRLGLFCGSLIALSVITISSMFNLDSAKLVLAAQLFRGPFLAFMSVALFGLSVHFCQRAGINHVLIFDIDPRNHLNDQKIAEMGAFLLMIWMICLIGFCHSRMIGWFPTDFALVQVAILLLWLFNPFDMFSRNSRYWFLLHLFQSMTAPFWKPSFVNFWLSEQLTSLPVVFADLCFAYCNVYARMEQYLGWNNGTEGFEQTEAVIIGIEVCAAKLYAVRAFFTLIPCIMCMETFLRQFVQIGTEHPALTAAAKYSLFIVLVTFRMLQIFSVDELGSCHDNPFCYFWGFSCILAFVYASWWDLSVDWGLLHSQEEYLRPELVFHRRLYYYVAIASNILLRFAWIFYLSNCWLSNQDVLVTTTAVLECLRRFIWNLFSLEFQHLNNRLKLRAARDIKLKRNKRKRTAQVETLVDKIDSPSGITHRKMGEKPKEETLKKLKRNLSGLFMPGKYQ